MQAGAIQNLTLDGRAINHFLRNELDHDPLPGIAVEMVHRSDDDTGTLEESLLGLPQQRRVEAESGPVGELPIPEHDRLRAFISILISTNRNYGKGTHRSIGWVRGNRSRKEREQ